jgi:hypothetical protein
MMQCKLFNFADAPFRKVNFSGTAGIYIRICDAEGLFCIVQLALIGAADE